MTGACGHARSFEDAAAGCQAVDFLWAVHGWRAHLRIKKKRRSHERRHTQ
jgi:hypothetical protein